VGTRCADHVTPLYPQKLALISPTSGGRSIGIVRSRAKAMEFSFSLVANDCFLRKELALCHPAGTLNSEACLTFLEDLYIPGLTCSDLLGPNTNFLIVVNVKVGF
jgi:hypothetical protein